MFKLFVAALPLITVLGCSSAPPPTTAAEIMPTVTEQQAFRRRLMTQSAYFANGGIQRSARASVVESLDTACDCVASAPGTSGSRQWNDLSRCRACPRPDRSSSRRTQRADGDGKV
jgi:hypothetical protein